LIENKIEINETILPDGKRFVIRNDTPYIMIYGKDNNLLCDAVPGFDNSYDIFTHSKKKIFCKAFGENGRIF